MRRELSNKTAILLVLAGMLPSFAHGTDGLELDDAVRASIDRSPAVRAARAELEASEAGGERARGFRLPSVDLMEAYTRTDNPAEVFALSLNQERFDMEGFFMSDPNRPDPIDNWLTRLEVTQPLYTGGKVGTKVQQADHMASASELQWRHTLEQVAFETATAFANLTKAREQVEVVRRARDTTAAHVRLAEQYAAQGLLVQAEVLKARVHLAHMEEQLAEAESGAALAEANLNFHMGLPQTEGHELAPLPAAPAVAGPLAEWVEQSVEARLDLRSRREQLEAGRLEARAARSGYLPEVAVVGRYDLYDASFLSGDGSSGSLMASARINLFRGGSDAAALAEARARTRAGEANIARFEEAVRLESRQAWQDLRTAASRHATARTAVQAATEALHVRERRFAEGLDTMIDLLDAETQLHESELRELVARYNLSLATYRLYFASGTSLLDLFGVSIPEEDSP